MANSKSKSQRKAQVAARSAHVQKTAGGNASTTTNKPAASATKKQVATRKATPVAPAPKGPAARVKAVATRSAKPAEQKPTSGKLIPKSGKLKAGEKAPAFSGQTATGEKYSLRQALSVRGNKGAIIYFYPKAGTPGCTAEACDFRDSVAPLEAAGFAVVGVSPDTPEQLRDFASKQKLPFTLISDADHKIAAKYGVWDDGHRLGVKMLGQKSRTRRSTFVIDPKGKLLYAKYDVQAKDHVKRLREALSI